MKKIALFAALVLFLALSFCASAYADDVLTGVRVTVSEQIPEEFSKVLNSTSVWELERQVIDSKGSGQLDYGIIYFTTDPSVLKPIIRLDAYGLYTLTPSGGDYKAEFIGEVFLKEKVAWFKSEEAKKVFLEATQ